MKSIFELCKPRTSVFNGSDRDDVLDLSDLRDGTIDTQKFFEETFMTGGLEQMIDTAFQRFVGKSDRGVIRLTQNMGGGKSHCMIALGLLAKNPVLRYKLFGDKYNNVNQVNVIAYTGRENDIQYGIWGEIARQLGKESAFNAYYSPLSAPGQSAWVNLLKNDIPTLILLDEIPPYLEDATTKTVGTGTLADVTVTALSNLFTAVSKKELSNVLIVIADLRSNYERGNALVEKSFTNLDNEIGRYAMNIEPVNRTNDDLYNILKRKCFKVYPEANDADVIEIAESFRIELAKAKQTGITGSSPDALYSGIVNSYPFHPCVKDLFGRFKENINFQQTRGFIRLVRNMVRCLWNSGEAKEKYIINAYDIDLRDTETYSTVRDIKPKLDNAISHDIVSQSGVQSMAEECDQGTGKHSTEELCKMILVSSLADIPTAILGLTESEMAGFIVGPTYSISNLKQTLEVYHSKAWYLYVGKDNRVFYKDIKNVNAELATRKNGYNSENAKQYVQKLLLQRFQPKVKDAYQEVLVFPAIDQINLSKDKVTLILFEPNPSGNGLQKQLQDWYDAQSLKNRVCFLTGQINGMVKLLETAKEAMAISSIIDTMVNEEHVPENDTQLKTAKEIQDRVGLSLCSALKEIFVTLYYPSLGGLKSHQINMEFGSNDFRHEEQIRQLLGETVHKFITVSGSDANRDDMFRKRIEQRIFTTDKMLWSDIEQRAAETSSWNWYHPSTLKDAKARYIQQGFWVEKNGMVDKNPPQPKTDVNVHEVARNDDAVILKISPLNGDIVYYEIGQPATIASTRINTPDLNGFQTNELELHFLCIDSTGKHETGVEKTWRNITNCRYNTYDSHGNKMLELKSEAPGLTVRYTLDGSDPRSPSAATYISAVALPKGKVFVQAIAYSSKYDFWGDPLGVWIVNEPNTNGEPGGPVPLIDKNKSLVLSSVGIQTGSTKQTYELMGNLSKVEASINGISTYFSIGSEWFEFNSGGRDIYASEARTVIDSIAELYGKGTMASITVQIESIKFPSGERFESWIATEKREVADFAMNIVQ
jgi:hypothetical protein